MVNIITGAVAIIMLAVFLGKYAITLNAVPLWVIILGVLAMAAADYVLSLRGGGSDDQ